jgi:RNA polymerase sigma-70 factor (ECF subfamily)
VAQTTDADVLETTGKQIDRGRSARAWAGLPKPALTNDLHKEILALLPRLRRYARVLTRDVVGAEDLVQDCLARALEKIHLWQPGTDLRAWLFTILYRQYISHARRDARHRDAWELQESDASLELLPNQTARLELRDLERALARLPEEQRSVILLVGLEGMDYAEAAAAVNAPLGTVRSRIARGRENLRKTTGLFPARHSHRKDFPPVRRQAPPPKSQEVVQ